PPTGEAATFPVYGVFVCSPVAYTDAAAQNMALARLLTREEQAVTTYLRARVAAEGTLYPEQATFGQALARVERHLAENYGSRGLVVLSLDALYRADDHVYRTATGLFTAAGTPVVVDRTDPNTTVSAIPAPVIYRSEVFTSSNAPGDLLDRG